MHGLIEGIPPGSIFSNREKCRQAGIHRAAIAGIAGYGNGKPAESVVVAGGYEDDLDQGSLIIYTGEGGNDPNTGGQIADQTLTKGNLGLSRNWNSGVPVRVVRSIGRRKKGPPYRYDGLFRVSERSLEKGHSEFYVFRFRLEAIETFDPKHKLFAPDGSSETIRNQTIIQRVVRQTSVSDFVKELHDYRCQICGHRITIPTGGYAEAAHIRPLGRPHEGPDQPSNVLCLCANCHVEFDRGAIGIENNLSLINRPGSLQTHRDHQIELEQFEYHRSQHKLS